MAYDKIEEYTQAIFNVFKMVNKKADMQNDRKFKMIALLIYNYTRKLSKDYEIDLKELKEETEINLFTVFEYIISGILF